MGISPQVGCWQTLWGRSCLELFCAPRTHILRYPIGNDHKDWIHRTRESKCRQLSARAKGELQIPWIFSACIDRRPCKLFSVHYHRSRLDLLLVSPLIGFWLVKIQKIDSYSRVIGKRTTQSNGRFAGSDIREAVFSWSGLWILLDFWIANPAQCVL